MPRKPSPKYRARVRWSTKLPGGGIPLEILKCWLVINHAAYFRSQDCSDMLERVRQILGAKGVDCTDDEIQDKINSFVRNDNILQWLQPSAQSSRSQLDILISWLEDHYTAYKTSSHRNKLVMLRSVRESIKGAGFRGCTSKRLQLQIKSLESNICSPYLCDQKVILTKIFGDGSSDSNGGSDQDDSARQRSGTESNHSDDNEKQPDTTNAAMKPEPVFQDGSAQHPWIIDEADVPGKIATNISREEILRVATLIRERHDLKRLGVAVNILDDHLPMPPKISINLFCKQSRLTHQVLTNMPRGYANAGHRIDWGNVSSSGESTPLDLLVQWLFLNYVSYESLNRGDKSKMLEKLCAEMIQAGHDGIPPQAIRNKINRLQQLNPDKRCSKALKPYQTSLIELFKASAQEKHSSDKNDDQEDDSTANLADESDTEDEELDISYAAEDPGIPEVAKSPLAKKDKHDTTTTAAVIKADRVGKKKPSPRAITSNKKTTKEILRISTLLSERQKLEQQGVAMEMIDKYLPLP